MASVSNEFFCAVSVGSLDDLNKIIGKIGGEMIFNLAQSYNEMGETPLLVAISNRHLNVVQFLVGVLEIDISQEGRFSWKDLNYLKIPPLFAAIISDQMSIIHYLIETKKVAVNLDLFLSDSSTHHITELFRNKIDVLELIGAAYILQGDRESFLCGLSYWEKSESFVPVPVDEAMKDAEKFTTKDELIIQQALYVSQLVLRVLHLFPNIYILSNISKHSWMSWMYILKQLNIWWENSASYSVSTEAWNINKTALDHCFNAIRHEKNKFPASNTFKKLTFIFSFASEHLIRIHSMYWPTNQTNRADTINETTTIVCKLSVSIMRMLPQVSFQDGERFKQNLARYIHIYEEWETDKPNLFHRACNHMYVVDQKEPNYQQIIRLFLDAGANPNAIDVDGNIPLHCLLPKYDFEFWLTNPWDSLNDIPVSRSNFIESVRINGIPVIRSNFIESVRILLDAGSHLDQSNRRRESVLKLLKQNRKKQNSFRAYSFDSRLDDVINSVLPLTCYCAQSIQKNNIPVEKLPPTLQLFVRNH